VASLAAFGRRREPHTASTPPNLTDWCMLLLCLSVVLGSAASRIVDRTYRITDRSGAVQTISSGSFGGVVGVLLFYAASALAACAFLSGSGRLRIRTGFSNSILILVLWSLCAAGLQAAAGIELSNWYFLPAGLLVLLGTSVVLPSEWSLHFLNYTRDVTAVAMLVISAVEPESSQIPCRTDKCGIFGGLYTGFFATENAAAALVVLLLPAAVAIQRVPRLLLSFACSAMFVLASGSRTALINLVIVSIFVVVYRRRAAKSSRNDHMKISRIWLLLPVSFFTASAYVFTFYSGDQLTGRGRIYSAIREQLSLESLLIGSGPETVLEAYRAGFFGRFQPFGEHGQVPHLIVYAGLPAAVLFLSALLLMLFAPTRVTVLQTAAVGLLVAASLQFVTEPGWTLNPRNLQFLLMLLSMGLFSSTDVNGAGHKIRIETTANQVQSTSTSNRRLTYEPK